MNLIEKIRQEVVPILDKYKLVLVKIENVHEYGMNIYRVTIDNPESNDFMIDVDDVAAINQELLDIVNDDLPDDGYLEITSLGIERELITENDFARAIDKYIYVLCFNNIAWNAREFYGYLKSYDDDKIIIDAKNKSRYKEIEILRNNIKLIRLAVEFNKRGEEK